MRHKTVRLQTHFLYVYNTTQYRRCQYFLSFGYMHIAWKETTHSDGKQHIERHIERHIQEKNDLLGILDEQVFYLKLAELFGKRTETSYDT